MLPCFAKAIHQKKNTPLLLLQIRHHSLCSLKARWCLHCRFTPCTTSWPGSYSCCCWSCCAYAALILLLLSLPLGLSGLQPVSGVPLMLAALRRQWYSSMMHSSRTCADSRASEQDSGQQSTAGCNGTRRTQDQCRSSMCSCQHTKGEVN